MPLLLVEFLCGPDWADGPPSGRAVVGVDCVRVPPEQTGADCSKAIRLRGLTRGPLSGPRVFERITLEA